MCTQFVFAVSYILRECALVEWVDKGCWVGSWSNEEMKFFNSKDNFFFLAATFNP